MFHTWVQGVPRGTTDLEGSYAETASLRSRSRAGGPPHLWTDLEVHGLRGTRYFSLASLSVRSPGARNRRESSYRQAACDRRPASAWISTLGGFHRPGRAGINLLAVAEQPRLPSSSIFWRCRLAFKICVAIGNRSSGFEGQHAEGSVEEPDPNALQQSGSSNRNSDYLWLPDFECPIGHRKKIELEVQTRLFRDGQQVYTGTPRPMETANVEDPKRLLGGGRMQLGDR